MTFFDAHNHLQDDRFLGRQAELIAAAAAVGVEEMMVNGACAADWLTVARLASAHSRVRPSFGWHPWYLQEMPTSDPGLLRALLEAHPEAAVGEIGLDRWILEQPPAVRARYQPDFADHEPVGVADQVRVFVGQLVLANELDRPVTIHCLQAWGALMEVLRSELRPKRGFLLHSYGGPVELVPELTRLGGFFSFPGYFAWERKVRRRDVFRSIPMERLLVETDAPDQLPPETLIRFPLSPPTPEGRPLNHPANLTAIYAYAAEFLGIPMADFSGQVADNYRRLFGRKDCPPQIGLEP